jgi:tetratricopeptide (TPR) repeat protein
MDAAPALSHDWARLSLRISSMSTPSVAQFEYEIGACMSRGDWAGAERCARACREAWPGFASGWLFGSMVALFHDQRHAALSLIEEGLAREPRNVQCLIQQAECHLALGNREQSLAAGDAAAAAAATDDPRAFDAIGTFFAMADDYSRALAIYDRAVAVAPGDCSILAKRALVLRYLGRFDLAAGDYRKILSISPHFADALKGLTDLENQTEEHNCIAAMEAALASAPAGSSDAVTLRFGLAKSYEDLGDYASSWRHLSAGARLERARLKYDPRQDRGVVDRIIAGFTGVQAVTKDATGESPIFIVGLPRTGTTLVERIVGNHSEVHSAGELLAMRDAIGFAVDHSAPHLSSNWLDYAQALGGLDGEVIAREYLARSRARRGDRPRFSDKAPANFYYCGIIFRAFPNARIVHVTRHPLAACYAIYKTLFIGGFAFSYDLGELADYYIGYRRLMDHWHRVLPGRILNIAYEDVVNAQEATTRRLLDYLDLPFESACIDFHLNPAPTSTPSSVQVRQPLYKSSIEQWRHYADGLAPLRDRLISAGILMEEPAS